MYIRIAGREVMGLTPGERRSLHPDNLGRKPTWGDVKDVLKGKRILPVVHHIGTRVGCDGCSTRVFAWGDEVTSDRGTITGRRFCATCTRYREATLP